MRSVTAAVIVFVGMAPHAFAQFVTDDFETGHVVGETPMQWSIKWEDPTNAPPIQASLLTVEAGMGVDGSQGLVLDVTTAERAYHGFNTNGITGEVLTMSVDVQCATTGEALGDPPSTGVNDPFIGLAVSTTPNWFDGGAWGLGIARRADNNWGVKVPQAPWITGWKSNADLGLAGGLTASTSGWFKIVMTLTDKVTSWEAVTDVYPEGSSVATLSFTMTTTNIPSGATLYGGVSTHWNNRGEIPIGGISKVSSVVIDNFVFGGPTVQASDLSLEDVTGYQFTSEVDKTHRLQYTEDNINYFNTGASVVGDGTEMVLIDPAPDTSGRTYRVTSD